MGKREKERERNLNIKINITVLQPADCGFDVYSVRSELDGSEARERRHRSSHLPTSFLPRRN